MDDFQTRDKVYIGHNAIIKIGSGTFIDDGAFWEEYPVRCCGML